MRERSTDPFAVFERGMAAEIEAGAVIELIARGRVGTKDVEGWYVMLRKPNDRRLLLLNARDAGLKFIKTTKGVFNLLERLPAEEVTVPLLAQVENEQGVWAMHAELNRNAEQA
ncbi:hypothetical protein [Paenirhodobacter populi]|uniref:Uncharacterized protein n=1 Tax=Paenirhodobacter populi TaxID=2306993 RepID=A0A443JR44_9RHOB|nr:hypothetical protein [Sinirhodobacter populi]RWR22964.1 hypothetical protein D2T30_04875 [Sinirhodobacter populi]